jgi:7-carboxy-7-deazaguanine synthase
VWLRFFTCNLQCDGFGQSNPTDPATYVLPYKSIDVKSIQKLEDLPVFTHGCDSSYSWSAKFKHLQHKETPTDLAAKLIALLPNKSWSNFHFCITGGEPLLPANQKSLIELWDAFEGLPVNVPTHVTFETNGTQKLSNEFLDFIRENQHRTEFFFSLSPKLFSVSGEKDAVVRNIIKQYNLISSKGQLKFVVNGTDSCWEELESSIKQIREVGVDYQLMLMPVGATKEQQESLGNLVDECCRRGYRVTPRAHCHWYSNPMGK